MTSDDNCAHIFVILNFFNNYLAQVSAISCLCLLSFFSFNLSLFIYLFLFLHHLISTLILCPNHSIYSFLYLIILNLRTRNHLILTPFKESYPFKKKKKKISLTRLLKLVAQTSHIVCIYNLRMGLKKKNS